MAFQMLENQIAVVFDEAAAKETAESSSDVSIAAAEKAKIIHS